MTDLFNLIGFLIDLAITIGSYAIVVALACAYIHKNRTKYVKHGF